MNSDAIINQCAGANRDGRWGEHLEVQPRRRYEFEGSEHAAKKANTSSQPRGSQSSAWNVNSFIRAAVKALS